MEIINAKIHNILTLLQSVGNAAQNAVDAMA